MATCKAVSSREHLQSATRIVVKLGTHVVTHDGVELALGRTCTDKLQDIPDMGGRDAT